MGGRSMGMFRDFDEPLETGGDAQTQGCLTFENGGRVYRTSQKINCADVTVTVQYSAEESPPVKGQKQERFVFGYLGNRVWIQQLINRAGSYCLT